MDDAPSRLTKLFEEQRENGSTGGRWTTRHQRTALEQAYLRQAEAILVDDNPFKFVFVSTHTYFSNMGILTMKLYVISGYAVLLCDPYH